MATGLQSTKENGNTFRRARPTSRTNSTPNSELMAIKSTINDAAQGLQGLAPTLHGLAPKHKNSASARRRKTNDPAFESLFSCERKEHAIDGVRATDGNVISTGTRRDRECMKCTDRGPVHFYACVDRIVLPAKTTN